MLLFFFKVDLLQLLQSSPTSTIVPGHPAFATADATADLLIVADFHNRPGSLRIRPALDGTAPAVDAIADLLTVADFHWTSLVPLSTGPSQGAVNAAAAGRPRRRCRPCRSVEDQYCTQKRCEVITYPNH